MAGITAPGIGSNLDVNSIVTQLMTVEKQPLAALDKTEADYQVKISAYGGLKSSLSSFQAVLKRLEDSATFSSVKSTSSDTSVLTVSAQSGAIAGADSIEVRQLASAQRLASAGVSTTSSVIGTGTISIQLGTYDSVGNTFTPNGADTPKTITIDAAHSSLSGIRDAINASGAGVTASIVNDGSASGNRLVLTANKSGTANSLKVTVADDDGANGDASGLSFLSYDPTASAGSGKNLTQTQPPTDALFKLDGLDFTKSSNTVTDAIQGVTLNLVKTNVGAPAIITTNKDNTQAKGAIHDLVTAFNGLASTIRKDTAYDATSKTGGPLNGDSAVRAIQSQIKAVISDVTGDPAGSYHVLGQIGVSFQKDGTLSIDDAKLDAALSSDPKSVASLFSAAGSASDPLISNVSGTTKTTVGTYAVAVSQVATKGAATGTQAAALTITGGVNDQLSLRIDGVDATVTLDAGTYATADALVADIQSRINGTSAISGNGSSVAVTQSGGVLTVTSNRYGSTSVAKITGGDAMAGLFGASTTEAAGLDVGGTINGTPANGSGQLLSGSAGEKTEGLTFQVNGGSVGARGTVSFERGVAAKLDALIDKVTGTNGTIAARTDGLDASIKRVDQRRDDLNRRLTQIEATYRAQFSALDTLVSQLTSTENFLTQQIANLPKASGQ